MRRRSARGFTLVELMVVITIVGVLMIIGLPNFRSTLEANRVATTTNEFLGAISLARGDAITTTRTAGVCAANADGTACVDTTDWADGWLVWRDADVNPGYQPGTDLLLRHVQPRRDMTMTVPASGNANVGNAIVFDNRGRAMGMDAGTTRDVTMHPSDCAAGRPMLRTMALSAVGHVTMTKGDCT